MMKMKKVNYSDIYSTHIREPINILKKSVLSKSLDNEDKEDDKKVNLVTSIREPINILKKSVCDRILHIDPFICQAFSASSSVFFKD